jgi:Protein of unknwon function (DUF3310)
MEDMVNHPRHYKTRGIEAIDATRGMGFSLGNSVKYVYRAWSKGMLMQDLEKARWYMKDHIAHSECHIGISRDSLRACRALGDGGSFHERKFFHAVASRDYLKALEAIEEMICDSVEQD